MIDDPDEVPELSDKELAEMRPAREVLSPEHWAAVTGQRGLITPEDLRAAMLVRAELLRQEDGHNQELFVYNEDDTSYDGTIKVDGTLDLIALHRAIALGPLHLPDDRPAGGEAERVLVQHGVPARYSMGRAGALDGDRVKYWMGDSGYALADVVCWWELPTPLSTEEVAARSALSLVPEQSPEETEDPPSFECPKCGAVSGDSWSSCDGSCPIVGSPYYDAAAALRGILRRAYTRGK